MQAMFLKPIYKDYIWGGFKISKLIKNQQSQKIAESLEIVSNKDMQSIILNGKYKDKNLEYLFNNKKIKRSIFGNYCIGLSKFPVLIKYIDAKDNLSIQVHPNDYYAKQLENTNGKSELWYVLDCEKDSKIICGLKDGVDKEKLGNLNINDVDNYFNFLKVEKGDVIYVEAGTVHAILSNILICEIQQNSDITYRVYDWDRNLPNRPLHIEKSKKVINTENKPDVIKLESQKNKIIEVFHSSKFYVDKINVKNNFDYFTNVNSFQVINIISGEGTLEYSENKHTLKNGDCLLLPANLGNYSLRGNLEILITYIGE